MNQRHILVEDVGQEMREPEFLNEPFGFALVHRTGSRRAAVANRQPDTLPEIRIFGGVYDEWNASGKIGVPGKPLVRNRGTDAILA
jgi:hypothetical protein